MELLNYHEEDKKHSRIALLVTLAVHVAIALVLMFTLAWAPPDPPIEVYGIEVNFGTDNAGFGKVQTQAPPSTSTTLDKAANAPTKTSATPPPVTNEPPPVTETKTAAPTPVVEEKVQDAPKVEETPEPIEATETQSDVVVPKKEVVEEKKEAPPKKVEPDTKPTEAKPKETTENTQQQKPVEEVADTKPVIDPNALLTGESGTANQNRGGNQGNVEGAVGDQGSKQGSLNADALLDSKGGKGGSQLDMPGWVWNESPVVKDPSSETGRVVIEIKVDNNGNVISANTIYRDVSRGVANLYMESVKNLTFEPKGLSGSPPMITTGRVTFVITLD